MEDPEEKKMILGAGSMLAEMDAGVEQRRERLTMRKGGTPNIHSGKKRTDNFTEANEGNEGVNEELAGSNDGAPEGAEKLAHFEPINWNQLIQRELPITSATAKRWIELAKAIQKHYRRLPGDERLREIFKMSPGAWTKEEFDFITEFVKQIAAGKTQLGLQLKLGIKATPKQRDEWKAVGGGLKAYGEKFKELNELEVREQIWELEEAAKARRYWLAQGEVISNQSGGKGRSNQSDPRHYRQGGAAKLMYTI
jgi:hypothetical protein